MSGTSPDASPDTPEGVAGAAAGTGGARPARSLRRSLASVLLTFELVIIFLAALVIWGLSREDGGPFGLPTWVPLAAGGVLILLTLATIALLRFEWAYAVGWALQVLIIAAGLLNPAMYLIGAIFGGMWAYCMIVGARIDRAREAETAPGTDPGKEPA